MPSSIFINQLYRPPSSSSPETLPSPNTGVRAFHQSLPGYKPSPLVSVPAIAARQGIRWCLVKDETERLGLPAFKILGASWATYRALGERLGLRENGDVVSLQRLAEAAKAEGVVLFAATDGNHGRAVARMAGYLGVGARIYVPSLLDEEAISKIRGEGAEVVVYDGDYDQTVLATKVAAENHAEGKGVLISDTALTVDDETANWIVEGYQTMFDEMEEQVLEITGTRTITHVVTPVGVGSLTQAVVTHFQRTPRSPKPMVIAVEPKSAACLKASLEAGEMTSVKTEYTICTGMCCGTLSAIGWPMLKSGISAAVAVEDSDVDTATKNLQSCGINAGPCGAASLAALESLSSGEELALGPQSVVVLLCTEGRRGYEMRSNSQPEP
ncbi:diaminopropionate ammonia-lyase family protein [Mollisia scopiformis]|uniref:Diaminopropionate ammonia-lyase family protein n=1 Tax=Mollisia scopiformis TaxID=149040 RepID=A0A194X6E5_MOLSC|nr:diaminopropionate ammonia-lyase family protein [Mollisia scopiformis]KUJ15745.1 diaminopropionate ammonia-lyase family protein [Mollisia scopiformis]